MSVPSYIKLSPQMDMATLVNALNNNFNQVQSQDRRKVITDEDGKDRIVLGKQEDGTYAIKVSADGADVGTATDDQLVMNSDWNMWKIIASGQAYMPTTSTRRAGNITLNSTYIGYTHEVFIPIRNLPDPTASSFASRIQLFVRDWTSKQDLNFSGNLYNDGTNRMDVVYSYRIREKYLVIKTDIRWVSGSLTFAPRDYAQRNINPYWEIANPTRFVPGGIGGGGSPAGKYVYYDSVVYNPTSETLSGYVAGVVGVTTTIAPGAFSAVYSMTHQFDTDFMSYIYPLGAYPPSIPAVGVVF